MSSSASSSTPRKKQVIGESSSARKGKSRGPPTPNPPLAPFPTPPSTRHRKRPLPFEEIPPQPAFASPERTKGGTLPPHLQNLLALQEAFTTALNFSLAIKPPILPPHSPDATKVSLPNITTLLALKDTVEKTGKKRFGQTELARLAWLWTWDGHSLPSDSSQLGGSADDNPFLVGDTPQTGEMEEVAGLSYLITATRTLDAHGKRVWTHGIGVELDLKPSENRSMALLGGDAMGGGMGAVGRWNSAGPERNEEVKRRLERWVELHGGYHDPVKMEYGLPTPSSSREGTRSSIPPIPLKKLPYLPSSGGLASANIFSSIISGSPGLSTPPKKPVSSSIPSNVSSAGLNGLDDPFVLDDKPASGGAVKKGGVEARRQAMLDRIKARSGPGKEPLPTLGSAITHRRLPLTASEQQETLKRRSTLSRLEGIAEGVWMMFSASTPGPSSMPTPPRGKRKAIPMHEAADLIVKSSKTPISNAEATTSLQMLANLCPFFLVIKTVARQDWISLGNGAAPPPSPGDILPSAVARPAVLPPAFTIPTSPTSSPRVPGSSPRVGLLSSPVIGSPSRSPGGGGGRFEKVAYPALSGPASPGRVRKGAGLREVREKIRRELDRM